MKFSTYLENITGISVYPLISLILFVAFFILVTIWMYSLSKKEIEHIEHLPLDN
jgi:hypothetical protein